MDPRTNPYTPNAGAMPRALVGRDDQLAGFDVLLARIRAGMSEQSMVLTGLRGVGKTVLLTRFRETAMSQKWVVVEIEATKHDDAAFRRQIGQGLRKALLAISPRSRWGERARRAAGVLRSFSLSVDPEGVLTAGLQSDAVPGEADSGQLDMDLVDTILAVGEAARDHDTGVALLVDEIQFLTAAQLEAVIMALHKCVQRQVPVTLVGAGLPQIAELAGEAKSYSERLLKFPRIDALPRPQADEALAGPARAAGVDFTDEALGAAFELTGGYPYIIQELGYATWLVAEGPSVSAQDVADARGDFETKLDSSFFRVRLDQTTELERAYLRAMAELGPGPKTAAEVAQVLDRTSQQVGATRKSLISKGLLYAPQYGLADYTVPHFDRFMRRIVPRLVVPPIRPRRRSGVQQHAPEDGGGGGSRLATAPTGED